MFGRDERAGMQGVAGEEEAFCERGNPAGLDEVEVACLVCAVDFVADDGVAAVRVEQGTD